MKVKNIILLGIGLTCFLMMSCQSTSQDSATTAQDSNYADKIKNFRLKKDSLFLHSEKSPIPLIERDNFDGLKYFPINPDLKFEAPIIPYEKKIPDTIIGTKGDIRPAIRFGYIPFKYKGTNYKLQIYKFKKDDKYLFLGFTDETTGTETYGTGRYIDLELNGNGKYTVDFNLAYNPYCAYNPRFTCAIPPAENHLSFRVTAGEKVFHPH